MLRFAFGATLALFLLASSCVTRQQYNELEETLDYYKSEALATDSIRGVNDRLVNDNNQTEADYRALVSELEELTATNISLNRSYQDLVRRYNSQVGESQRVLATSSYETTNLEQELAQRQMELDRKERQLTQTEYQLQSRESELQRLEARGVSPNNPNPYETNADPRYQNLAALKASYTQRLNNLQNAFQRVLVGFPPEEVALSQQDGHLVLTLSKSLVFPQSDTEVHWKGRQALQQIAVVLRENPDLMVETVGHQYASNNPDYDWDVSTRRALAVTRSLATFGVDPANLQAAGQGSNHPVVSVGDPRSQQLNSRTEIIIKMDYSQLLNAIE